MAMQNTFEFIGELRFGKEAIKTQVFDSGWTKRALSLSVVQSSNNSKFVNLEGGFHTAKENKVHTMSKTLFGEKGSYMVVDWENRFDKDTINSVPDFKKIIVDLTSDEETKKAVTTIRNDIYNLETKEEPSTEDKEKLSALYKKMLMDIPERHEFLSTLDAIDFVVSEIAENPELKNKKYKVKGVIEPSYWKGDTFINHVVQSIELVDGETKNKLSGQVELYYTKSAMDKSSFKKERKMHFDTYISHYSREHEGNVMFPYPTLFNATNHDDDNPKHVGHIGLIEDSFTVKGKAVYRLPFEIRYVNGSEEVEVTAEALTKQQQRLVDLGLASPEDYVKKAFGDAVVENRIYIPQLKDFGRNGNFNEGALETDLTEDDLIYTPAETKEKEKPKETKKPIDVSEDDLPF